MLYVYLKQPHLG